MNNAHNSPEEWQQDLLERQQNLTPADITRRSEFRNSGLRRNAPLPIAIEWKRIGGGTALFVLGICIRLLFGFSYAFAVCTGLAAAGLFMMLSSIRWTSR